MRWHCYAARLIVRVESPHWSVSDQSCPEPVCHFLFGQHTAGQCENHVNGFLWCEADLHIVQCQEQARQHPCGAFIPIREGMIARHSDLKSVV